MVLLASEEEHHDDHVDIWCIQGGCTASARTKDMQSANDWLRRHSYAKHNPEGKELKHEDEQS